MNYMDFLADCCRAQAEQFKAERAAAQTQANLRRVVEQLALPAEVPHQINPQDAA